MDKDEVIKTVKDALKNNTLRYEKLLIRLFSYFEGDPNNEKIRYAMKIARFEYLDVVTADCIKAGLPLEDTLSEDDSSGGVLYLKATGQTEYDDDADELDFYEERLLMNEFSWMIMKNLGKDIGTDPSFLAGNYLEGPHLPGSPEEEELLKEVEGSYLLCGRNPALRRFIRLLEIVAKNTDPETRPKKMTDLFNRMKKLGLVSNADTRDFIIKAASICDDLEVGQDET